MSTRNDYCAATESCAVETSALCPASKGKGKLVERRTPENLLLDPTGLGEGPFYFCADPECEVVYFDATGRELYNKDDLKVRVGQKEKSDPIPVCYCFDVTEGMLRDDIARSGTTLIPKRIKDEVAVGNCACEVKNPQGSCCLGNLNAAVRAIHEGVERT